MAHNEHNTQSKNIDARAKRKESGAKEHRLTNAGTPFFADGYGVMIIGKKQRPASAVGVNAQPACRGRV
jgi:hypothetical protein